MLVASSENLSRRAQPGVAGISGFGATVERAGRGVIHPATLARAREGDRD